MSQEEANNNGAAQGLRQSWSQPVGPDAVGTAPDASQPAAAHGGTPGTVPQPPAWQAPPDPWQAGAGSPGGGGPYGSAEYARAPVHGARGQAGSARAELPRPSRSPFKRRWWSVPKVVVAGVIVVLLAGAGGGAIGYGVGEASAPHRGPGTGQFGGGRYHGNFGPGAGGGSGTGGGNSNGNGSGTGGGNSSGDSNNP